MFIQQDDSSGCSTSDVRSSKTSRSGTNDQEITMTIDFVVAVRVRFSRGDTDSSAASYNPFIGVPQEARKHQCFVVKARRHQLSCNITNQ